PRSGRVVQAHLEERGPPGALHWHDARRVASAPVDGELPDEARAMEVSVTPDTRCHLCSHRQGSTCPAVGPLPARWLVRHGASLAPRGCPLPPPDEVEPRQSCAQAERPCPVSTCRM